MTVQTQSRGGGYLERPSPSSLADVVEIILDKGIVIDAYVRVSLVGIELLTIDARIVVASVDTYLRFAEAVNRLDLESNRDQKNLPEMIDGLEEGGAEKKTKGALEGAKDTFSDLFSSDDDDDEDEDDDRQEGEDDDGDDRKRRRRRRQPANRRRRERAGSRE